MECGIDNVAPGGLNGALDFWVDVAEVDCTEDLELGLSGGNEEDVAAAAVVDS